MSKEKNKIQKLLSQHENRRFDWFKDGSGNIHQVDRTETKEGHYRVLHMKNGKKEEGYISHEEYQKIVDGMENVGNFKAYEELKQSEAKKSEADDEEDEKEEQDDDSEDDEEDDSEDDE